MSSSVIFKFPSTLIFLSPKMVFAIACGFANNYYVYVVIRFLIAINVRGGYMIGFVLSKYK